MTAASFSIASSLVGLASFLSIVASVTTVASPLAPIAAAVLGITASVLELKSHFSSPPGQDKKIEQQRKGPFTKQLDYHAKFQLFNVTKTPLYKMFDLDEMDIYVIHQGYLLKWRDNGKKTVEFGTNENEQPRKWYTKRGVICSHPIEKTGHPAHAGNKRNQKCPYLVQGDNWKVQGGIATNAPLGFSFYGFARNFEEHRNEPPLPYNGAAVFITTDMVQPEILSQQEESAGRCDLKGLKIFTYTKGPKPFDDFVSIADMPNLDTSVPEGIVEVKTGSGNDILNIEGRIGPFTSTNVLRADLGEGQNVLSFQGLNGSNRIKGLGFNAKTGDFYYKYDAHGKQCVGKVKSVTSLVASPLNDEIYLHGNSDSGQRNNEDHDFIVTKLEGLAKYKINVSLLVERNESVCFLIRDYTLGILDGPMAKKTPKHPPFLFAHLSDHSKSVARTCHDHVPVLQLLNLQSGEKPIYKEGKIFVPGTWKRRHTPTGHVYRKGMLAIIEIRSACDVEIHAANCQRWIPDYDTMQEA